MNLDLVWALYAVLGEDLDLRLLRHLHHSNVRVNTHQNRLPCPRGSVNTHLAKLCEMDLQRLRILVETQRSHRIKNILSAYCLALLKLALLRCLRSDEGNELGDAFLYAFFRVFRYFGGRRHGGFHYPRDVGYLVIYIQESLIAQQKVGPTGRKRSCSLYSPTSCSVMGTGSGGSCAAIESDP